MVDLVSQPLLFVAVIVALIAAGFVLWLTLARRRVWARLAPRFPVFRRSPAILEILPDAIIGVEPLGTVRSLNAAASRMFGYREREVRGQPLAALIRGATAFRALGRAERPNLPLTDSGIRTEAIRKDGVMFPAMCFALHPGAGRDRRFVLVRDQSQQAREEELHERCAMLQAALCGSPVPLLVVDRGARVLLFSRSCEHVLGPGLVKGAFLDALFPGALAPGGLLAQGDSVRLLHTASGYTFTSSRNGDGAPSDRVVLMGEAPAAAAHAGIASDVIRRLEDLMTEIGGYTELLLCGIGPDDPIHEDLSRVNQASRLAVSALRELTAGDGPQAVREKRAAAGN